MEYKEVVAIDIKQVRLNPHQPRQFFDHNAIKELATSIEAHGLIQPIVVRQYEGGNYELIVGERRLRAFQYLQRDKIPAIIETMEAKDSAMFALIENLQRENLNFMEVAEAYQNLMRLYDLTQKELAEMIGKSQSTIANKCRILELPSRIIYLLIEKGLTERHARALLKVKDYEGLEKIVNHIIDHEYNVRQTEKYIEQFVETSPVSEELVEVKESDGALEKSYFNLVRNLTQDLKQVLEGGKGSGMDVKYDVKENEDKYTITIEIPLEQ